MKTMPKTSKAMASKLKLGAIRQRVTINATPEEVYNAMMDPKIHSAFTGAKATCTPKVGGRITAWDGYIIGRNLKLSKGRRIIQEWKTTEWPKGYPPSVLDITLKRKGRKTLLLMVQSKVPASQMEDYREGWKESYWDPMNAYLKNRV